jgi:hypothetical protein
MYDTSLNTPQHTDRASLFERLLDTLADILPTSGTDSRRSRTRPRRAADRTDPTERTNGQYVAEAIAAAEQRASGPDTVDGTGPDHSDHDVVCLQQRGCAVFAPAENVHQLNPLVTGIDGEAWIKTDTTVSVGGDH